MDEVVGVLCTEFSINVRKLDYYQLLRGLVVLVVVDTVFVVVVVVVVVVAVVVVRGGGGGGGGDTIRMFNLCYFCLNL